MRTPRLNRISNIVILLIAVSCFLLSKTFAQNAKLFSDLKFRCIGPAVTGGRIHDVEALPNNPSTIYIATASGGIWKSTNKGTTWEPIFENQPVSTFGDVAIARSNSNVIWAGTGEQNNRQSTSWGNGVYLSKDGGKTWTHKGLVETRHIGRICVHPQNPDIAYVAALGNLWKGSQERGVFKTTDGGNSWKKVLFIDQFTGVVDLVMDPENPNIFYAAAYQRLRRTWGFNGGGQGSGIYKTIDGGKNWTELKNGIPKGDKGRIGLSIAKTNSQVLHATIEHGQESGIYRTEDGGNSWTKVNRLNPRPMYYSHIYTDPTNENRVYVLSTEYYKSEDGGKTFRQMPARPTYDVGVHSDFHTMWIDPNNPKHFYLAGDAGLHETWDMGETFIRINNIPIGQFYAIGVDMEIPYNIYGGMQDNHSWMGPSATRRWIGIVNDDWRQIGFGDGMYHQVDPTNHKFVYSNSQNGNLTRLDAETGDMLDIRPYPPSGEKAYRFDWVTPSLISLHDPKTIYFGGNRLFISHDRGISWQRTDDLTRQIDRNSLSLMGKKGKEKLLSKNDGTSSFGEIITIAESPLNAKILWIGTDDGNIQMSQNSGQNWDEVSKNIKCVKDGTYVSRVISSVSGEGVAYVTFDAHRDGDFAPYVFKTEDFGRNWKKITNGLPKVGSVNVIIEHPKNPNLLFLGTEHTLFVSIDAGKKWLPFKSNLSTTLYDDLKIHPRDNDLIVGTHGRSIWILDDLSPLVEFSSDISKAEAHLFSIQPATIFHYWKATSYRGQNAYAGKNPPFGAILNYYLSEPVDSVQLTILNHSGDVVRKLQGSGEAGIIHRTSWDLRYEPPLFKVEVRKIEGVKKSKKILPKLPHPVTPFGPFVKPGSYTVKLKAGDIERRQTVIVKSDPQMPITLSQWQERETFTLEMLTFQNEVFNSIKKVQKFEKEIKSFLDSMKAQKNISKDDLADAKSMSNSVVTLSRRFNSLRGQVFGLANVFNGNGVRQGTLYPPTKTHYIRKEQLKEKFNKERKALKKVEAWAQSKIN